MKLTPSLPKKPGSRNNKHRHVLAGEKYEAGQLRLVPYSTSLFNAAVEGKEKTPLHSQFVQIKIRLKETFAVTFQEETRRYRPSYADVTFDKHIFVPYWHVQGTGCMDRANMQLATLNCTMSVATGTEETADDGVLIPILQNFKALEENEELLVFDEAHMESVISIEKRWRQVKRRQPGYLDIHRLSAMVGRGRLLGKVYNGMRRRR